jgi:transketolase
MSDLRKLFFEEMCKLAEKDKDVILIVGDLGYSFDDEYKTRFPKQYLNAGCIEQGMVGISAGMALAGKKPYVYSNSIFLLSRAHEQVRDDIAYNNLDVKLIGTGASGFLNFTHNWTGTENENDLLKNLPIEQFYPTNQEELKEALTNNGGAYIRL